MTRVKRLTPFVLLSTHQVVTSRCGSLFLWAGGGRHWHTRPVQLCKQTNKKKNRKALTSTDREGVWCEPLPQKKWHHWNFTKQFFLTSYLTVMKIAYWPFKLGVLFNNLTICYMVIEPRKFFFAFWKNKIVRPLVQEKDLSFTCLFLILYFICAKYF